MLHSLHVKGLVLIINKIIVGKVVSWSIFMTDTTWEKYIGNLN